MTSEERLEHLQKAMSNTELIKSCEKEIHNLCKTGGRSIHMSVPPRIQDTDMLLCELIGRFKALVEQ